MLYEVYSYQTMCLFTRKEIGCALHVSVLVLVFVCACVCVHVCVCARVVVAHVLPELAWHLQYLL